MKEKSTGCRMYEHELIAQAGAEPSENLKRHLAGCPGCRACQAQVLRLAARMHLERPDPELVLALARASISGGGPAGRGNPLLWPLFSASLTATVLILHFGVFSMAQKEPAGSPAANDARARVVFPDTQRELELPEGLAPYERIAFPTPARRDPS